MATKISRRKLASYVADELLAGNVEAVEQLAAYLVAEHRTKEAELLVRDIETALATRGVIVADVTTARQLTAEARQALEKFVASASGAANVTLRESIDPSVIGGARIATPNMLFDGTVANKLEKLGAAL